MASQHSKEKSSPGNRNVFPGLGPLNTLSYGIPENQEPIYSLEEKSEEEKIFSINESVRSLIVELETKEKENTGDSDESKTQ